MALLVDRLMDVMTHGRRNTRSDSSWFGRAIGSYVSSSNERINEGTTVSISAVWRAICLLSGVMGRMPKRLVLEQDEANKSLVRDHPVARMLRRRVSTEQTTAKWFQHATTMCMLWGNAYSEIVRKSNDVVELYYLHPSRMTIKRDARTKELFYEFQPETGGIKRYYTEDILHISQPSVDGVTGLGLMELAKHSMGLQLALQKYGGALFGNGIVPGLVLEHPGELGPEGQKNLRESIEASHRGPDRAFTSLILEEGMKASTLSHPNDSMQFNETRSFQVNEIARYIGVPPHLLFLLDRATFSNIEHLGIEFVKFTVDDWICSFTSEMEAKLLPENDSFQIEIDTTHIERGDSKTFSEVLEKQVGTGLITFNEARRSLGRNSIGPEGDVRVINKAYMLTDRLQDEPPDPADTPFGDAPADDEGDDGEPPNEDQEDESRARAAAAIVLRESMQSLIGVECDRLERALKRAGENGDAALRVNKFYDDFGDRVVVAFTPAFSAYATFTGSDIGDIVGVASEYVETQRRSVLSELSVGHDPGSTLDEWRNNRADQVTDMYFGGSNHGA